MRYYVALALAEPIPGNAFGTRYPNLQVKDWLQQATGLELSDSMDMFCARYDHTDYLSCHDDELEGRKIAYIFYLVPDAWAADDGGALDLFETDAATGHPGAVARSLVPTFNSLAFFEVTPRSWHQVRATKRGSHFDPGKRHLCVASAAT